MKNKIFDILTNQELVIQSFHKNELKEATIRYSNDLMKIRIVAKDFAYEKENADLIEAIGIDENNQIVIFEYKKSKLDKTITNGLFQLDYIRKHKSEFKMLINDSLGLDIANETNYEPRLIVFSDHFHRYDYESIRLLPYCISLIELKPFDQKILLNLSYINKQSDLTLFKAQVNDKDKDYFMELRDYIFALGEEVFEYGMNCVISYRRVFNFVYIYFSQGLHVCVQNKDVLIQSYDDCENIKKIIEEEYDKS